MNVLRLIPEPGGDPVEVDRDQVLIGRDPACEIHIRDASVSRQHAEIRREGDDWVIIDLNSGNGVRVDGVLTTQGTLLPAQRIEFGNVCFRVEIDRGDDGATVILGRSPLASTNSTPGLDPSSRVHLTPPLPENSRLLLAVVVMVSGLVLISFTLLVGLYLSTRRAPAPARRAEATRATTGNDVDRPTPIFATPTPEPSREAAAAKGGGRRGTLLISSDSEARLVVDGTRQGIVAPGQLRRIEVLPGRHVVSFRVGTDRHDEVVRAKADEPTTVRFSGPTSSPAISTIPPTKAAPSTPARTPAPAVVPQAHGAQGQATPVANRVAVVSPLPTAAPSSAPLSGPPPIVRPTTAPPAAAQGPSDEGLVNGAAAAAKGDYYRAILILKDVTGRLEKDPRAGRELARAHAYLALAYQGLNRPEDAQAAADKALRADPAVVADLSAFPASVVSLFKRPR